jgi:hypothetical protein
VTPHPYPTYPESTHPCLAAEGGGGGSASTAIRAVSKEVRQGAALCVLHVSFFWIPLRPTQSLGTCTPPFSLLLMLSSLLLLLRFFLPQIVANVLRILLYSMPWKSWWRGGVPSNKCDCGCDSVPPRCRLSSNEVAAVARTSAITLTTSLLTGFLFGTPLCPQLRSMRKSLPMDFSSSILVVHDRARPFLMKALIFGPDDTPYDSGAFCVRVPSVRPTLSHIVSHALSHQPPRASRTPCTHPFSLCPSLHIPHDASSPLYPTVASSNVPADSAPVPSPLFAAPPSLTSSVP